MNEHLDNLKEIKEIMTRSSRVISLSGWSGISAGMIALLAAFAAYMTGFTERYYIGYKKVILTNESIMTLLTIAMIAIILTLISSIYFTRQKLIKDGRRPWDAASKQLIFHLALPLVTGGLVCLILIFEGYIGMLPALTLIFYGLSLVNASKYTLSEVRNLGILEIILGLVALQFVGYGLLFWSLGFGVLHIVYGALMHQKYGA